MREVLFNKEDGTLVRTNPGLKSHVPTNLLTRVRSILKFLVGNLFVSHAAISDQTTLLPNKPYVNDVILRGKTHL